MHIGNFMFCCSCILYSVLHVVRFQLPFPSLPHRDKVNSRWGREGEEEESSPSPPFPTLHNVKISSNIKSASDTPAVHNNYLQFIPLSLSFSLTKGLFHLCVYSTYSMLFLYDLYSCPYTSLSVSPQIYHQVPSLLRGKIRDKRPTILVNTSSLTKAQTSIS